MHATYVLHPQKNLQHCMDRTAIDLTFLVSNICFCYFSTIYK